MRTLLTNAVVFIVAIGFGASVDAPPEKPKSIKPPAMSPPRKLFREVTSLQKRLETARAKGWHRDVKTRAGAARWGKLAREFQADRASLDAKVGKLPPDDRIRFVDVLNFVDQEFLATAANNEKEYQKMNAYYIEISRDLDKIITSHDRALIPSVRP